MTAVAPEMTIQLAAKRFGDVVHRLVEDQPVWDLGAVRTDPALYRLARTMLTAASARSIRSSCKSKVPARVDVLDWLSRFDVEVGSWSVKPLPPCEILAGLAGTVWAPDDLETILGWTATLEAFTAEIEAMCGLTPVQVPLRGVRCPRCDAATAYRRSGNEQVRTAALTVSEHGAQCHNCQARWRSEVELRVFTRMVGVEALV